MVRDDALKLMCSLWENVCIPLCVALVGPVEADPEYQLIVDSNNLIVEVDNEICE